MATFPEFKQNHDQSFHQEHAEHAPRKGEKINEFVKKILLVQYVTALLFKYNFTLYLLFLGIVLQLVEFLVDNT